jgi:hypothetical protein
MDGITAHHRLAGGLMVDLHVKAKARAPGKMRRCRNRQHIIKARSALKFQVRFDQRQKHAPPLQRRVG